MNRNMRARLFGFQISDSRSELWVLIWNLESGIDSIHAHLSRLATKSHEKCGLTRGECFQSSIPDQAYYSLEMIGLWKHVQTFDEIDPVMAG
jgi:hypothetical protein